MLQISKLLCLFGHIFLLFSSVLAIDLFNVSRNGSFCGEGRTFYFVYNSSLFPFPDRFTYHAYGSWEFDISRCSPLKLPVKEPIASMWHSDVPNEVISALKSKITNISAQTVERLPGFANAAILYRPRNKDWIVKIAAKPPGAPYNQFLGEGKFRVVRISADEANTTSFSHDLEKATEFLEKGIDDWSGPAPSVPYVDFDGADCRMHLIQHDERVILSFSRHNKQRAFAAFDELRFKEHIPGNKSTLYITGDGAVEMELQVPSHPDIGKGDQKNWIPFDHDGELLFLSHIWPTNVVDVHVNNPRHFWIGSATPYHEVWHEKNDAVCALPWQFGNPHGSSPTIKLGNGEYLAFFHSYRTIGKEQVVTTYVMGAYTFRFYHHHHTHPPAHNESVPHGGLRGGSPGDASSAAEDSTRGSFMLTSISKDPIIPLDSFYTGRWYHDTRLWGFVDYTMFSTSILREGDYIFVMYAYQNARNYVTKFKLLDLLESMTPVTCASHL